MNQEALALEQSVQRIGQHARNFVDTDDAGNQTDERSSVLEALKSGI